MMNTVCRIILPLCIPRNVKQNVSRNNITFIRKNIYVNAATTIVGAKPAPLLYNAINSRNKSNKEKQQDSDDEEDYDDDGDASLSKDSRLVKINTTSMRTDTILRAALGVARNKIELAFYESRIRVNGKKILKKSAQIREHDEIDLIKSVSPKNPEHLFVSRVQILTIVPKMESISVMTRRFKRLLIENYEEDPYKGNANNEQ